MSNPTPPFSYNLLAFFQTSSSNPAAMPGKKEGTVGELFIIDVQASNGRSQVRTLNEVEYELWRAYWTRERANQDPVVFKEFKDPSIKNLLPYLSVRQSTKKFDEAREKAAELGGIPVPIFFHEGGRLETEARRLAKLLFVSCDGFSAAKVAVLLFLDTI